MRTGRSWTVCRSLLLGGGGGRWGLDLIPLNFPLGVGLDLIPLNFALGCRPGSDPPQFRPSVWAWIWSPLNFPLECGPVSDPPQFPPWVWAWIWSPSISPLGVGLDLIPLNFPLGCGPGGGSLAGGSPSWWGLLPGGCLLLGELAVSQHALRQTPPWTESQTRVKT